MYNHVYYILYIIIYIILYILFAVFCWQQLFIFWRYGNHHGFSTRIDSHVTHVADQRSVAVKVCFAKLTELENKGNSRFEFLFFGWSLTSQDVPESSLDVGILQYPWFGMAINQAYPLFLDKFISLQCRRSTGNAFGGYKRQNYVDVSDCHV